LFRARFCLLSKGGSSTEEGPDEEQTGNPVEW
jgi:hypothetical protein